MSNQDETPERPEADTRFELGPSTRRTFLSRLGMAGLLATTAPVVTTLGQRPGKAEQGLSAESKDAIPVTLRVNGKKHDLRIDPRTTLLDCLREHLHLTGSKKGCDHGQCGACTVHINGRRVNSCLCFAAMHEGEEITTVEGIGQPENLQAVQAAFVACDAYQFRVCGKTLSSRKRDEHFRTYAGGRQRTSHCNGGEGDHRPARRRDSLHRRRHNAH